MNRKTIMKTGISFFVSLVLLGGPGVLFACDIAVVSSAASSTGRPLIMKVRDNSMGWEQEVTCYKRSTNLDHPGVGGSVRVTDKTRGVNAQSGGVNEAGFAITNTMVYQKSPIHEYLANANLNIMSNAIIQCITVSDFDAYMARWHEITSNKKRIISGTFVVIDAVGGAALYEITTGDSDTDLYAYGGRAKIHKIDANTGFVTNEDGDLIGNDGQIGMITDYEKNITIMVMDQSREIVSTEYALSPDRQTILDSLGNVVDGGDHFCGIVNRTNSSFWVNLNDDTPREDRALDMMLSLKAQGSLNYRSVLQEVSRDVAVDEYALETYPNLSHRDPGTDTQKSTFHTINRYCTNLAFVVDGVVPGDDPRLSTMWTNLGEPSVGVAIPVFPAANNISDYLWADTSIKTIFGTYLLDFKPTCYINQAINNQRNTLYDDNTSVSFLTIIQGMPLDIIMEILKYDKMLVTASPEEWAEYEGHLIEWHDGFLDYLEPQDTSDITIDMAGLIRIQNWTRPLEDKILDQTEAYLNAMRLDPDKVSQGNISDFSEYCAQFMYDNYSKASATQVNWGFDEPWETSKSIKLPNIFDILFGWF
ncbi:MAG: hypothetical protein KKD44_15885 [Proteobacteria bacterium]|nr:hypothetical protein [Pseudomonadota bacterium]